MNDYDTPIICDSCEKRVDEVYELINDKKMCSDCGADELFELEKKLEFMFKELNLNIKASEVVDFIDSKVRG